MKKEEFEKIAGESGIEIDDLNNLEISWKEKLLMKFLPRFFSDNGG